MNVNVAFFIFQVRSFKINMLVKERKKLERFLNRPEKNLPQSYSLMKSILSRTKEVLNQLVLNDKQ